MKRKAQRSPDQDSREQKMWQLERRKDNKDTYIRLTIYKNLTWLGRKSYEESNFTVSLN